MSYSYAKSKYEMWLWELNFRWSVDDFKRAIEAQKKATRYFNIMMNIPAQNIERSVNPLNHQR